jgi:hypothetical protein
MSILENEFSWSVSRDRIFKSCPRKYYFHYYGSWGGWDSDAEDRRRRLYILKQLQNRLMWAGRKVHEGIEQALLMVKTGSPVREGALIDRIVAEMRQEYLSSRKKIYLRNPKSCGLYEHEYDVQVSNRDWRDKANHVVHCLKQFFLSPEYQKIRKLGDENWLEIENLSYFSYHGVKIFVMLDLAFREDTCIRIYDWKTGKENDKHLKVQLACYGLYAKQKWYADSENIHLTEFNLASGRKHNVTLKQLNLEKSQHYIRDSIAAMLDLLDDTESNRASEKRFAFAASAGECRFCNFYKECPRYS